jgi:hypothetical protein
MRFHMTPRHLGVPSVHPEQFLGLWYVRRKPCTYLVSWLALSHMNWIEHPLEPCNLEVPSSASKTISEALLCLAQTVHLSCTDTYTVLKRTKTRFHMTHVTLELHPMHPKQFPSQWYFRHKPCTFPASRSAPSQNRLKWASTWTSNLGVPSRSSRLISLPMVRLAQTEHPSCTETRFHVIQVI